MMADEPKREGNATPKQVVTEEDLRRKIEEVRKEVEKASEPRGPLAFIRVTTST
jgi:hypothetical protein